MTTHEHLCLRSEALRADSAECFTAGIPDVIDIVQ